MTTSEPITFQVEYTQADMEEAASLISHSGGSGADRSLWAKIWKHVLVLVMVILLGVYLYFRSSSGHTAPRYSLPHAAHGSGIWTALPFMIIIALIGGFCIFIVQLVAKRHGVQGKTFEMTFDESGQRMRTPTSETFFQWSHFRSARENDRIFLLIIGGLEWMVIPKRAIPDAATVDRLRGLIEQNIGPTVDGIRPSAPPPPPPVASGDSTIP